MWTQDRIEEALFARHRDLFSELGLVFFDTTSIYFEGEGGETLGARGHCKALFRTIKSVLETRPIFHHRDATIRGHVFCSFLALVLRKALLERVEAARQVAEWTEMIEDLEALQEVEVAHQNKRFRLRTEARGSCGAVFRAVSVALPPTVQQIREVAAEA